MIATVRAKLAGCLLPIGVLLLGACNRDDASRSPTASADLPAPLFAERQAVSCGTTKGVGESFEDFELPGLEGDAIKVSDFRGRVVLLNFWGTWCKPCLEELPEFSALYRSYRDHGLSLIAVSTDDDPQAVEEVAKHHELTAHFAVGGEALAERQGEHDFPFTYLLGPDGKVIAAWDGYEANCLGHVEDEIRQLLASP